MNIAANGSCLRATLPAFQLVPIHCSLASWGAGEAKSASWRSGRVLSQVHGFQWGFWWMRLQAHTSTMALVNANLLSYALYFSLCCHLFFTFEDRAKLPERSKKEKQTTTYIITEQNCVTDNSTLDCINLLLQNPDGINNYKHICLALFVYDLLD